MNYPMRREQKKKTNKRGPFLGWTSRGEHSVAGKEQFDYEMDELRREGCCHGAGPR